MRARFLLGPAGSGKTFRCLAEIRDALRTEPAGPPLVFLAPKQATFQIERQLLADPVISGYTRLNILSFDRLAQFVFDALQLPPPRVLSPEGRIMVLRALLLRHEKELKLFRQSAQRPGFAQELSAVLAELQQHQFTVARLLALAGNKRLRSELQNKLHDLGLLLDHYEKWLADHQLQDANRLLELATAALREKANEQASRLKIERLWLDGFAEMTPQELDFLAAITPYCTQATLAFCLENESAGEASELSIWSAIGQTFKQCLGRIKGQPDCQVEITALPREADKSRFAGHPELAHLEKSWAQVYPSANELISHTDNSIRVIACQNPEAEVAQAARAIRKFVRAGNRFRDCALLFRSLEGYHSLVARTFRRQGIPFFLDRRESVAHHPLTELTRSALRLVAFDWQHDDWFAALKTGFCPVPDEEIDGLENLALERGWRGRLWRESLPDSSAERLREKIIAPFANFWAAFSQTKFKPTGIQLAEALRELWAELGVEKFLERWTEEIENTQKNRQPAIHATVLEQMNAWLDNLALAFPDDTRSLSDWLPVLEAGLAGLTVGVIPPVLDEVLVGAIDRARNPNLKLTIVAGVNESIFPATPETPVILTHFDRIELADQNTPLGPNLFDQLARERYLGYIACTRSSEKLVVTYSRLGSDGKPRNPSPFIGHLQRIFPKLALEDFSPSRDWREAESAAELIGEGTLLAAEGMNHDAQLQPAFWSRLSELPSVKQLQEQLQTLREPSPAETLPSNLAEQLYGSTLISSVSRLEEFAQCPFRFFVHSGLRANERKIFELDARERGSFQHEILRIFHAELVNENKRWRDLTPGEARERIGRIAGELSPEYGQGLLRVDAQSRFDEQVLTRALQEFVSTLITWMRGQYDFDPVKAEWAFGGEKAHAPAWTIALADGHQLALHGKIDRIDLCQSGERTLVVVTDYKSSQRKLDKVLLQHGVQLQLLGYLAAVQSWPPEVLGVGNLFPAGVFYMNLRGQFESGGTRNDVLNSADEAQRLAYRHSGRFDAGALEHLDRTRTGDQFSYRINKDGSLRKGLTEALPRDEFLALLNQVEVKLRQMGEQIFSGATQVDPYRKNSQIACEYCDYRAICRIDQWTHQWRVLRAEPSKTDDTVDAAS